ncbi:MAG: hypothetical protein K2W79_01560 [Hydrotalea flava]|uniref:hypothetical protein n=1 Tax=Hydrotalea TaxID=1004300 RepID=UPI0009436299|nr:MULTISPECIES: hypothetical protein [Hydrotalea]MBY0346919.1 hypothetical protein [Hydrotalea flava]RWZ87772.1 MAG: hypothetical protein EO766_10245 [Hydrotalea sp. AMD]
MAKAANKKLVDVIDKILDACYQYNPDALFILSLMHQYEERGSLSKKQLQGLLQKAGNIPNMPANWLGTLEAIILKMPDRHKIAKENTIAVAMQHIHPDAVYLPLITAILQKYPQHKGALLLQTKCSLHQPLTNAEKVQLKQWEKLLK